LTRQGAPSRRRQLVGAPLESGHYRPARTDQCGTLQSAQRGIDGAGGKVGRDLGSLSHAEPKGPGRHPRRGRGYIVALGIVFTTGTVIASTDWSRLWYLAALGAVAVALAAGGYIARHGTH
jgi:hypothetical protein